MNKLNAPDFKAALLTLLVAISSALFLITQAHATEGCTAVLTDGGESEPTPTKVTTVRVERAWLFEVAEEGQEKRHWLEDGDRVVILQRRGLWSKIRARCGIGKPIVAWTKSANLR